jgi:ubiquinone/menaquinone biosynthesis C-methylase UbiE
MLTEARALARSLRLNNTAFCQGDAEALPLGAETCDVLTCKLAFHYFPHPQMALQEMRRVTTRTGRVVLIDRVSAEDATKRAYQNQIETLRTPAKTYVYSVSQLVAALEIAGFVVDERADDVEHMEAHAWIEAAGPDAETAQKVLAMLTAA